MPKLPTDYSRIVIYVIKCLDDNITEEYIGSTTDFIKRKNNHKTSCNNEKSKDYNQKIYQFIRINGGWNNWIMIELEKYPCNDKREAEKREEEIRVERKASLNSKKAFVGETIEEYRKKYKEENKDKIIEYHKEYYEANKDKIIEYHKEWYEANKEKAKEQYKIYREANKNKIKEKHKEYRNKEYICSCGWIGTNSKKHWHLKNVIH
jgi:hypothetical protein